MVRLGQSCAEADGICIAKMMIAMATARASCAKIDIPGSPYLTSAL
jgi:hypothetical protein